MKAKDFNPLNKIRIHESILKCMHTYIHTYMGEGKWETLPNNRMSTNKCRRNVLDSNLFRHDSSMYAKING